MVHHGVLRFTTLSFPHGNSIMYHNNLHSIISVTCHDKNKMTIIMVGQLYLVDYYNNSLYGSYILKALFDNGGRLLTNTFYKNNVNLLCLVVS